MEPLNIPEKTMPESATNSLECKQGEVQKKLDVALTSLKKTAQQALDVLAEQRKHIQKRISEIPSERLTGFGIGKIGERSSAVMELRRRKAGGFGDIAGLHGKQRKIDTAGQAIMKLYADGNSGMQSYAFHSESASRDTQELAAAVNAAVSAIVFASGEEPSFASGKNFPPRAVQKLLDHISSLVYPIALLTAKEQIEKRRHGEHGKHVNPELMETILVVILREGFFRNNPEGRRKIKDNIRQDTVWYALNVLLGQGKIVRIFDTQTRKRCCYVLKEHGEQLLKQGKIYSKNGEAAGAQEFYRVEPVV